MNLKKFRVWAGPNKIAEAKKLFLANGWQPVQLDSGEIATRQLGSQFEYGAKLHPSTGCPQDIEYLHLFVTATPVKNGICLLEQLPTRQCTACIHAAVHSMSDCCSDRQPECLTGRRRHSCAFP